MQHTLSDEHGRRVLVRAGALPISCALDCEAFKTMAIPVLVGIEITQLLVLAWRQSSTSMSLEVGAVTLFNW